MIPATPLDNLRDDDLYGMTKLMVESRLQFDVVEPGQEWERYGLVVLPEGFQPDAATVERLHAFVKGGGALIVCHRAGLAEGEGDSWLERYGFRWRGMSPVTPAYLVPQVPLMKDLPPYEYALYEGASQWTADGGTEALARLGEPLFQRSAERYTSHRQSPFDKLTDFAVLARSGSVGLVGFPMGASYRRTGYWVYRAAFERLLGKVYPRRLVETDAPLNAEVTVTRQAQPARHLVHVVNWSPNRNAGGHPQVHEDPVPLHDVTVRLNLPVQATQARVVGDATAIDLRSQDGGVELTIPTVAIHAIVEIAG
jgi:hypothetical protein